MHSRKQRRRSRWPRPRRWPAPRIARTKPLRWRCSGALRNCFSEMDW